MKLNVSWSEEDKEWVGTCDEYPSLSWLDPDRQKALDGISELAYATRDDIARGVCSHCEKEHCHCWGPAYSEDANCSECREKR